MIGHFPQELQGSHTVTHAAQPEDNILYSLYLTMIIVQLGGHISHEIGQVYKEVFI